MLIEAMHRSVMWWAGAAYKADPPKIEKMATRAMALDDLASFAMKRAINELRRRWLKAFDQMAVRLARYFASETSKRTDAALKKILKDGGFSVRFRMTPAQKDVLEAIVAENVALIKSIPRQYLDRVEGMVMRSVAEGRNAASLYGELRESFEITKKRAILISHDQNSKATALLQRARFVETGVKECVWVHSGGGKHPRPTHVKAGREKAKFNPAEGWPDPALGGKRIWPGTEIGCKCIARPIVRGFS